MNVTLYFTAPATSNRAPNQYLNAPCAVLLKQSVPLSAAALIAHLSGEARKT